MAKHEWSEWVVVWAGGVAYVGRAPRAVIGELRDAFEVRFATAAVPTIAAGPGGKPVQTGVQLQSVWIPQFVGGSVEGLRTVEIEHFEHAERFDEMGPKDRDAWIARAEQMRALHEQRVRTESLIDG